jgi:hypothetical protein
MLGYPRVQRKSWDSPALVAAWLGMPTRQSLPRTYVPAQTETFAIAARSCAPHASGAQE